MTNRMRTHNTPLQDNHRVCRLKGRKEWVRIIGSIRTKNGRFVEADLIAGKTKGPSSRLPKELVVEGSITTYGDWRAENLYVTEPAEPVASEVVRVAPEYRERLERVARRSPSDTFSAMLGELLRRVDTARQGV